MRGHVLIAPCRRRIIVAGVAARRRPGAIPTHPSLRRPREDHLAGAVEHRLLCAAKVPAPGAGRLSPLPRGRAVAHEQREDALEHASLEAKVKGPVIVARPTAFNAALAGPRPTAEADQFSLSGPAGGR